LIIFGWAYPLEQYGDDGKSMASYCGGGVGSSVTFYLDGQADGTAVLGGSGYTAFTMGDDNLSENFKGLMDVGAGVQSRTFGG